MVTAVIIDGVVAVGRVAVVTTVVGTSVITVVGAVYIEVKQLSDVTIV